MNDQNANATATVLRRFPSKKNEVFLVRRAGELVVMKRFASPEAAEKERELLRQAAAAGLPVPRVLPEGFLSYVEAPTLLDLLEDAEARIARQTSTVADELPALRQAYEATFCWLRGWHRATGLIAADVNARNYLYDGTVLTGLDLEDARPGKPEEDIGRALAFMLRYDPAESPLKQALYRDLTGGLQRCATAAGKRKREGRREHQGSPEDAPEDKREHETERPDPGLNSNCDLGPDLDPDLIEACCADELRAMQLRRTK
ncbi:MAG: phosphotransferase [Coriobacteriia bacterium]|nr:phosphotransferase [Coriobacteriia bacterium]